MKNIVLLLTIGILTISSCKKDEVSTKTIFNNTDHAVKLTHANFSYTISSKETIHINSNDEPITAAVVSPVNSTDKLFDVTSVGGNYEVGSFDHWFEYRVSGTSQKTAIRYNSPTITNRDTVSLPYTISFKEQPYSREFTLRMEAHNIDNTNSLSIVDVEIYFKDKLVASDNCDALFCEVKSKINIVY